MMAAALSAGILIGCRKAEPAPAQPTPEQAAQIEADYLFPGSGPAPATTGPAGTAPVSKPRASATPAAAQPVQERLNGAVHAKLTLQLRMYIEKNGRVPDSFSEFVNSAMDSVPPAPDGMKFVIDATDRTVKAVKK